MSTKGWNSLKPITTPDQMSAPIHWNPMNEDWKMRLTKSQIYNTSSGFDTQTLDAMKKLHDKILTFGGDEVCMTMFDEDAPKILERGWIAIRNPSMGNTFLDMDETKTATKAQVNTIFDYISKFNRYDMNISKVMVD